MIEKMLKLTLLFHHSTTDTFLAELQRLGVFHIENYGINQTEEIKALEEKIDGLTQREKLVRMEIARAQRAKLPQVPFEGPEEDLLTRIDELRATAEKLQTERQTLVTEIERATRWGEFRTDAVAALAKSGFGMRLFFAPEAAADRIRDSLAGTSSLFEPVLEDKGLVYFIVLYKIVEGAPQIDAAEEALPRQSLSAMRKAAAEIASEIDKNREAILELGKHVEFLAERVRRYQNDLSMLLAQASLSGEAEGQVLVVSGWVPKRILGQVKDFLDRQEVVYMTEEPHHGETVPVLVKNRTYPSLFEPIMKIFSLPSYTELDTTPFLAPFYTIFFGLCIADMGFGLVLIALSLIALLVVRRKSARPLILLGLVLAVSVFVAGVLVNDFFGLHVTETFGKSSPISKFVLFPNMYGQMYLAMMLGIIQVGLGFILRLRNNVREYGAIGAVNPAGSFAMLVGVAVAVVYKLGGPDLTIGPIPAGRWIASIPYAIPISLALVAVGFVCVVFFAHPNRNMGGRLKHGMWQLYELVIGFLGDTLSYLRLFALGFAGGLLSGAIIDLSLLVKGDAWWGYIPMALVLLLGSGINLAIGLLSAFVHSLRLTFVEFYKAVGFKGGGIAYSPFRAK